MRFFSEIGQNRVLLVAVLAWFVAQALKVVFPLIGSGTWKPARIFGLGGMPSSHSSVVCGTATAIGLSRGFYSAEFALALVLAAVVMTDAAGVRRNAGRQAKVLNKMIQDLFETGQGMDYGKLKEMMGHSPFEVLVGALLGILLAVWIM